MQELDVTFGRAAQIWWAWLWRALLFALLFGCLAGIVVGVGASILGLQVQQLTPVMLSLGLAVGVIVSIWVLTKTLKKKFSSFRIALIQN